MLTNEQFTRYAGLYADSVFRLALNYMKNSADADDITQNVFLKLLREPKAFRSDDHVRYWLVRVTVNECKKMLRAPWRRTENIDDYAGKLSFAEPEHTELFHAVMALPQKYRVPIYLYYYEEYSTEEIAGMLKIPRATVCTQLRRGRELLRKNLQEVDANV